MAALRCVVFLLLLTIQTSIQKSDPSSSTYKAAVVQFRPIVYTGDASRTMNANADKSVIFIEQAAAKDADIIVFPELSLPTVRFQLRPNTDPWTTLIPDPSENYSPCTNSSIPISEALKTIACAAGKYDIYVVVNVVEKLVCLGEDNCPSDGVFYYVSNVVFDRRGRIVSRARKGHLFDEYGILDLLSTPEYSTFDTDFGVTFGNVVCLDILYEEPALTQTRKLNITDIVFTSGWFSQLPFRNTIQMEAGWAYAEDVNMLAGGYNKIDSAYSGSGIYAGRQGIVAAILPLDDHEELLVADVQKKSKHAMMSSTLRKLHQEQELVVSSQNRKQHSRNELTQRNASKHFVWKYENLDDYNTKMITKNGPAVQRLSQNAIDCEFKFDITNLKSPMSYRLFVYDGGLTTKAITLGMRICAIVRCADETIDSCGHIVDSTATFNPLTVTATYIDNGRTLMMPSTLSTNMLPFQNFEFHEFKYERFKNSTISLTTSTENLITFDMWGRNFELDKVNVPSLRAT